MYKLAISETATNDTAFSFMPQTDKLSGNAKACEIIQTFGLADWQAEKIPNFNEESDKVKNSYHIRRSDNKKVITPYVKDNYDVLQYDVGVKWLDSFIEERMLTIDSALMLNEGANFSVLSNIGMDATVAEGDTVERYLLLALSHDGKRRGFYYCDTRPVCKNTLYMAMAQGLAQAFKHFELGNTDPEKRLKEAKKLIDLASRKFQDERVLYYRAYNNLELDEPDIKNIFKSVLNLPMGDKDLTEKQYLRYAEVWQAYNNSPGMEDIKGTGWGVLNAITYFLSTEGKTAQDKFTSSTLGGNAIRKNVESLLNDRLPEYAIPAGVK